MNPGIVSDHISSSCWCRSHNNNLIGDKHYFLILCKKRNKMSANLDDVGMLGWVNLFYAVIGGKGGC